MRKRYRNYIQRKLDTQRYTLGNLQGIKLRSMADRRYTNISHIRANQPRYDSKVPIAISLGVGESYTKKRVGPDLGDFLTLASWVSRMPYLKLKMCSINGREKRNGIRRDRLPPILDIRCESCYTKPGEPGSRLQISDMEMNSSCQRLRMCLIHSKTLLNLSKNRDSKSQRSI